MESGEKLINKYKLFQIIIIIMIMIRVKIERPIEDRKTFLEIGCREPCK